MCIIIDGERIFDCLCLKMKCQIAYQHHQVTSQSGKCCCASDVTTEGAGAQCTDCESCASV